MHGAAEIAFALRDGQTRLRHLYQRAPLRVLLPREDVCGLPVAVLLTTSGGLVGGDRLETKVAIAAGARALVTQQAAEKVYRSTGATADVRIDLSVEDGGWLEWLPQETIVFEGARLRRRTRLTLAAGARLMAGEMLVFGRRAHGEALSCGFIHDGWEVRRDGRLIWADALRMDGGLAEILAAPACLAGAAALATIVFAGEDAPLLLTPARDLIARLESPGVSAVATLVGGVMITRWLAGDALRLRTAFAGFWAAWRHRIGGFEEALPRVWWV